jgi:hypothetical protein
MAKNTPKNSAATTYTPTLVLNPPIRVLTRSADWASRMTPRRLQRSAKIPDGTSSKGTTAAYAAAMTATLPLSKPISLMNNFSIETHNTRFWRKAAT